jgi:hypothetical protein
MVPALASFSIDTTLAHPSYRYFHIELRRVGSGGGPRSILVFPLSTEEHQAAMIKQVMASAPTRGHRLHGTPSQYWVNPSLPRVFW